MTNINILEKVKTIVRENGKSIIVLKGVDVNLLDMKQKYFPFIIKEYDKIDPNEYRHKFDDVIIENRVFEEDYKWMTIEEFQLFKASEHLNRMPIVFLANNLYDKQYPYVDTLSNVERIYLQLYYQEDVDLNDEDKETLETISMFYGKIDYSKNNNKYYITHNEVENKYSYYKLYNEENLDTTLSTEYPIVNVEQIELSEEEMPFLDLQDKILNGSSEKNILIIFSGPINYLPNKYIERLGILRKIKKFNIFFTTSSIKREFIENEWKYREILKKVFGYNNFKELNFYKSIETKSKELVEISQAQIIDDIVSQASKALRGESFNDIYITSSTGSGKSIMFQIPAFYLAEKFNETKPLTIVISPLISLMNDQVDSLKRKGILTAATINGNSLPYEKEEIINDITNSNINILYLSPETLQARSDIKTLIGDRKIGLIIVDEAHIVTTWGKSFRADYWYLGIYLSKLRKEQKFPIVTFTATAIYGGREDMYLDTRNSLNMVSPISYFGQVKRMDIWLKVNSSVKAYQDLGKDYRKTKNLLALKHIKFAYSKNEKSLLYFPTIKLLNEFYSVLNQESPEIAEKTGRYYGTLRKEEKDAVLRGLRDNDFQFVIATKAFGMGVDIPDINNVYHYAPTGNVVDYIQEIGRAARDNNRVANGFGIIDFLDGDMREVKSLYGMSAIKKEQILDVMRKILSIYKEKGYNRNLIVSPEDFKHIFVLNERDEDSLDNKVKTVLLMIEKDFESPKKLGYSPFVARPRSLFGNDLLFVNEELEKKFLKSRLKMFFKKFCDLDSDGYTSIYQVNLSGIWEEYYKELTFPSFKYYLFKKEERENLQHNYLFDNFYYTTGIEISLLNNISKEDIVNEYMKILSSFEVFANDFKIKEKQFTVKDLGEHFRQSLKISDIFEAQSFAQTVINTAFEFSKLKATKFIVERSNSSEHFQRYKIHEGLDVFKNFVIDSLRKSLNPTLNFKSEDGKITSFMLRNNSQEVDEKLAVLGIGDARKLFSYQVIGGNNPQIYLRINSVNPLEQAIKQGSMYKNLILKDVQQRHYTSVEMLTYLFKKDQPEKSSRERIFNYTKWFWNIIEDYFMGELPQEVKDELFKEKN